jgi:SAM-dependent methyltransferase
MGSWLDSPAGRYLREWEQAQIDLLVVDIFGFHALQLGLGRIDGLRANRMPYRWLALGATTATHAAGDAEGDVPSAVAVRCDFDALPFATRSLDLVVLPHTLELARDAHRALAEVDRVLRPEGRAVIVGFNPASLWGLRQRAGRLRRRLRLGGGQPPFLPGEGELIGYRRLRDWLRLLSFEVEASRFGGYGWPVNRERWLGHAGWLERAGDRWWPAFGALYVLVAVKRVRGMRLLGLVKTQRAAVKQTVPALTARHHHNQDPTT